jgi:hypothetical protein
MSFSLLFDHLCATATEASAIESQFDKIVDGAIDTPIAGVVSAAAYRVTGQKEKKRRKKGEAKKAAGAGDAPIVVRAVFIFSSVEAARAFLTDVKISTGLAPLVSKAALRSSRRLVAMGSRAPTAEIRPLLQHLSPLFTTLAPGGHVIAGAPKFINHEEDEDSVLLDISLNYDETADVTAALDAWTASVAGNGTVVSFHVLDGGFSAVGSAPDGYPTVKGGDWPTQVIAVVSGIAGARAVLGSSEFAALIALVDKKASSVHARSAMTPLALRKMVRAAEEAGLGTVTEDTLTGGYTLHPGLATGDLDIGDDVAANAGGDAGAAGGKDGKPAAAKSKKDQPFYVKFAADGREPKWLVFTGAATGNKAPSVGRPVVEVGLLKMIQKLTGRSSSGSDQPAELMFSQLGRFRALRDDIGALNDFNGLTPEQRVEASDTLHHRVSCTIDNFTAMGFPLPSPTALIFVDGLDEMISTIESAYSYLIQPARASIEADRNVEYTGLLEYYHVGDHVVAPASPLGGAPVVYRVCDCYYDSVRSVFGGKKLSFHLALECIVNLGDAYVFVSFDEIIGDWEGLQLLKNLPYQHLTEGEKGLLTERGTKVLALGLEAQYREYRSSCFFAHGASKGGASSAASAQLAASGRIVVDTARGIALGHHVSPGHEEVSLAVQATVKAYRTVRRAQAEGEASDKTAERIKAAGLRLLKTVPAGLAFMVWPALVGFSLAVKRWGHVLVDGLVKVPPRTDAWDRLVLDKSKKELLLSLVEQSFDPTAPRLRDLVSGKGSGSLFLLHGAPGVGKTLTVEALAERFGVPLYYLTFGELGTSVAELESTMNEALSLCAGWGALVLLDEGDALVERREKGALLLNSMVGVLLKALDAFEGLLFLTTNRVASFDPAALSRVTLAIRYGNLKNEGRRHVWSNVIERAGGDPKDFDLVALAKRGGSGRDINAAARLALSLAHHRKAKISQDLLMEVLDIHEDFRSDFDEGLKPHADGGRISDDED